MPELKRTALFPEYAKMGLKTTDFGGWEMPVQFTSIKKEHAATRTAAGLFDVSHMGEIFVEGPAAEAFLQKVLTNDVSKLVPKKAQYTIMCYENGGTVDDLIVYRIEEEKFLLVVNAANIEKDYQWLKHHKLEGVSIIDKSDHYSQLAIQGPTAEKILQKLTNVNLSSIAFFGMEFPVRFFGIDVEAIVARTGYTGEDGFEIYIDSAHARNLWSSILEAGEKEGIEPAGLGARDTLRFEAGLPLYGQELSPAISPIEAGLGFVVKTDKEEKFIGKTILKHQKEKGTDRKLVGIEMIDKGIPRQGYEIYAGRELIGFVTSGTQSPTLKKSIGLALIRTVYANVDTELQVQVRNRKRKAKVVAAPFYKRT